MTDEAYIVDASLRQAAAALVYVAQNGNMAELRISVGQVRSEVKLGREFTINEENSVANVARELASLTGLPKLSCEQAAREALLGTKAMAAVNEIVRYARQLRDELTKPTRAGQR